MGAIDDLVRENNMKDRAIEYLKNKIYECENEKISSITSDIPKFEGIDGYPDSLYDFNLSQRLDTWFADMEKTTDKKLRLITKTQFFDRILILYLNEYCHKNKGYYITMVYKDNIDGFMETLAQKEEDEFAIIPTLDGMWLGCTNLQDALIRYGEEAKRLAFTTAWTSVQLDPQTKLDISMNIVKKDK